MRTFIILLSIVAVVVGASKNRNALDEDTAIVSGVKAGTSKFSRWMELSDKEDAVLIVKVRDTSVAGYAGDSVAMMVGYQVADPTYDTTYLTKNESYARSALIVKDTILTANYGKKEISYGSEDSTGLVTVSTKTIDTTNTKGWATYRANIYPEFGVFIRFFAIPITGHSHKVTPIEMQLSRRKAIMVRGN